MVHQRDGFFSARRKKCHAKQRKRIRQFSQDGKQMKNTENRWNYRIGKIMFYDKIALERHDSTATKAARQRNSEHWVP